MSEKEFNPSEPGEMKLAFYRVVGLASALSMAFMALVVAFVHELTPQYAPAVTLGIAAIALGVCYVLMNRLEGMKE